MVMADYSEFNNNNYLPGVYNEMDAALNYHSAVTHTRGPSIAQNGFTFTSPTQCTTLATHRPSIQTTSPISSLSAPGIGTSWQHSIPVTMPWVDMKTPVSHSGVGTTTVFTGTPTSLYYEGLLSSSAPLRCPKRKAMEMPDEAPTSKIFLCADQFANLKISAGEKQIYGLPADDGGNTGVQFYTGVKTSKSKCDIEGWQRFRDIENRLDVEVEGEVDLNIEISKTCQEGPCLKVAEGVLDPDVTKSQILPRRVMEDITKPCMQVVLWKSPGEIIRDISLEQNKTSSSSTTNVTTISRTAVTNRMDTSERYPLTSRDNIMDTTLETPMLDLISNSHFQPAPSIVPDSFSSANFLLPTLLSNITQNPSNNLSNTTAASNTDIELVDLDMFDNIDDDMQL